MYFNVNFNVFFKLVQVHLLVSELYIHQNARCDDKKRLLPTCLLNLEDLILLVPVGLEDEGCAVLHSISTFIPVGMP